MRLILIFVALYAFWLVLSGHWEPWFTVSGFILSLAVLVFSHVRGMTDAEGFPLRLVPGGLAYWPWLLVEIVKSGVNVTRIILNPRLPISPAIVRVDALQKTSAGLTTYANSITLTPGTLTIEASEHGRTFWVHALERSSAEGFADDEMNRRVARLDEAAP